MRVNETVNCCSLPFECAAEREATLRNKSMGRNVIYQIENRRISCVL